MAGNYHSAKTLNKGESQVGMTFSVNKYSFETVDESTNPPTRDTISVTLPNLVPELTYHIGMAENLEVGGRVSLGGGGIEGDVKYRFIKNDKLHLAIAPAVSYQGFFLIEGIGARLPGILTYELADNMDVTAAIFGSATKYTPVDDGEDFAAFNGTLISTGGAIGFDLHGETFSIRPAVEFTRYVANLDDDVDTANFNTVNILVHIAWTGGKEKQQLNRIEKKIDALSAPPPPPPAPVQAPPPEPAPAPEPAPPGADPMH